jgi:hypothetical protein
MPDDPRNRPPPLPPRPLVPEPFRLTATPPSGGVPMQGRLLPPDPRDRLIEEMRDELAALRVANDSETADTEPPPTRPSVRVRKAKVARFLGKWAVLLPVVAIAARAAARAAAKQWPEAAELVDTALQAIGL